MNNLGIHRVPKGIFEGKSLNIWGILGRVSKINSSIQNCFCLLSAYAISDLDGVEKKNHLSHRPQWY